jgi:tight adherence protein C
MEAFVHVWQRAVDDPAMLAPIAIFFAVFGATIAVTQGESQVAARLARHRIGGLSVTLVGSSPTLSSWSQRLQRPAIVDRLVALLKNEKSVNQTRALLNRAGSPMSLKAYTRMRRLFTFVLTPLFSVLALVGFGQPLGFAAAAIMLLTLPRLPAMHLKRLAKKRAKEMDAVISDAMDLLVVCVEGGQSLSAGLMQLSQRMDNIAADEFHRLLRDINSGMTRRDAFAALADRCQSEALGIACTTIIHADKVGMSLAHTLRTLSDMMRTRRRQAAETRARQAPIKMMPVLVGFMLPTMLALLLGPVVLEVMDTFK